MPMTDVTAQPATQSTSRKKIDMRVTNTNTMPVVIAVSFRVGQVTFAVSCRTCLKNWTGLVLAMSTNQIVGRRNADRAGVAGVEGLEPPAFGFGDRRSTN